MTGVSIRLLAPDDDAAAIGEMTVAAYLTNEGDTDTDYHAELRQVARRARHCPVLVAVDDDTGGIVGTVAYVPGPDNPFAELERGDEAGFRMLAVDPGAKPDCRELVRSIARGGNRTPQGPNRDSSNHAKSFRLVGRISKSTLADGRTRGRTKSAEAVT